MVRLLHTIFFLFYLLHKKTTDLYYFMVVLIRESEKYTAVDCDFTPTIIIIDIKKPIYHAR